MNHDHTQQHMTLTETLRLAVPMHMAQLARLPVSMLPGVAVAGAKTVGWKGCDLQFTGGRNTAEAFNALARGLAAAALATAGGVTFAGLHWCAIPGCAGPGGSHPLPQPWPSLVPGPRAVDDVPVTDSVL